MKTSHAWAAGIVDGEGHIRLKGYSMVLRVGQSSDNGHPEMLDRLQELYGGTVIGPYRKGNHKPIYEWHVFGKPMLAAMHKMWPWLGTVKRAQYEVALARWEERHDR